MPRFVILSHDWPTPHWDFLVETGPQLRAWRLLAEPDANDDVPAEANFDHRLHYLDYEGPLSGQRGCVTQWDSGTFEGDPTRTDCLALDLNGKRLRGKVKLARTASGWNWRLHTTIA